MRTRDYELGDGGKHGGWCPCGLLRKQACSLTGGGREKESRVEREGGSEGGERVEGWRHGKRAEVGSKGGGKFS